MERAPLAKCRPGAPRARRSSGIVRRRVRAFRTVADGIAFVAMPRLYLRMPKSALTRYFTSFLGFMDIKVGCQIISLFSLFNKIAGVYGIIAVFQGGTFAQVSLYIYSIATIPLFIWGLNAISVEKHQSALRYAHLYFLDHMISTGWTVLFGVWWYNFAQHDGRPVTNSSHQAGLMSLIESLEAQYHTPEEMALLRHNTTSADTPEGAAEMALRTQRAREIWRAERGFAASVLCVGWLIKIYFAALLYAYALHLRHGTYWMLPLSKSRRANAVHASAQHSEPTETDEIAITEDNDAESTGNKE